MEFAKVKTILMKDIKTGRIYEGYFCHNDKNIFHAFDSSVSNGEITIKTTLPLDTYYLRPILDEQHYN